MASMENVPFTALGIVKEYWQEALKRGAVE